MRCQQAQHLAALDALLGMQGVVGQRSVRQERERRGLSQRCSWGVREHVQMAGCVCFDFKILRRSLSHRLRRPTVLQVFHVPS